MGILTSGLGMSINFNHPVYEGYSFEDNGAQHITMESYDDMLPMYEALSELDILSLRGEGEQVIESAVGNVMERVKNAFKKLWGKMKAFFESIMRYFDAMTKSAADFAKKYEKKLVTKSLSNYKFKMFNYTIPEAPAKEDRASSAIDGIMAEIEKFAASTHDKEAAKKQLKEAQDESDDFQETMRGELLDHNGKLDPAEFKTALFAYFRDGAESTSDKEEISVDIRQVIEDVKGSPKLKRAVDAAKKYTDTSFGKYLKALNTQHAKFAKDNSSNESIDLSVLAGFVSLFQKQVVFMKTTALQYYAAWIDAIKERDTTYKAVMRKAFGHDDSKED